MNELDMKSGKINDQSKVIEQLQKNIDQEESTFKLSISEYKERNDTLEEQLNNCKLELTNAKEIKAKLETELDKTNKTNKINRNCQRDLTPPKKIIQKRKTLYYFQFFEYNFTAWGFPRVSFCYTSKCKIVVTHKLMITT